MSQNHDVESFAQEHGVCPREWREVLARRAATKQRLELTWWQKFLKWLDSFDD